jgi:hypothetical protein
VDTLHAAAATEAETRSTMIREINEKLESANLAAEEAKMKQRALEDENQRLHTLLVDATREVQAASEGDLIVLSKTLPQMISI